MTTTPDGDRHAALRRALEREYRIEAVVKETAECAAYLARDLMLDRPVVIRAIDPAIAGAARTEAFRREARILAALAHPAIPSVHHAGPIEGFLAVVIEHPGDRSLESRLRDGPLEADEVLRLGLELLGALQAVHTAGFAHRRLHPGHVILAEGRYVLDGFGNAAPAAPEDVVLDLRSAAMVLAEAAGGMRNGGSSRLPRVMQSALRRGLSQDPAEQWRSAAEFRGALGRSGRPAIPWRHAAMSAAGIAVTAVGIPVVLGILRPGGTDPLPPPPRQLAILPFEVDGGRPLDPLGSDVAHLIRLNLDNLPGLELTSRRQVDQWWEAQGRDALNLAGADAARAFRAHWVARGLVERRPGDILRVQLTLHDSLGTKTVLPEVRGSANDVAMLGDSVTLLVIRVVAPRADSLYEPVAGLAGVPLPALKAFLQGEAAFARDAWALAQRHYEIALRLDSTFALAEWRLANVRRWRRLPYEHDLRTVYQRHGSRFRPRDRMLIEALLEPDLEVRFARLDSAVGQLPADGYARLLQGEELFHRGPLVGRGIGQAVPVLVAALERDPSLALGYDHLLLAAVRFGRREDARRAVELRRRVGVEPGPEDLDLVPFLELVYDERFAPLRARLRYWHIAWRADPRELAGIETLVRMGTPWLDMPETQLRYSDLLLRAGRPTTERHATAHEGKGLALFALGRPHQALAEIDSAAALLDSPESRLQQAEWRVIPRTLGLPDLDAGDWYERLEELTGDPTVGERAAWALALASYAGGDTAAARRWSARLAAGTPLRVLLEARDAAARGDLALALARTDSVRLAFHVTRPPDAFAGAAFHLLRGDWFAALGDRPSADAEWLWYEASDVEGWPQGLAQAGEVDAALGVFARLKRARAGLVAGASRGDTLRACVHLRRVVELWSDADPAMQPLAAEASTLAARCPR